MKKTAVVFGWIFLVLGVVGFFSNPVVSSVGWFHTDLLHNIIHIVTGVILLWVAYKAAAKVGVTLKTFGIIYFVVAILGFLSSGMILGIIASNTAADWLHLVVAVIFLWVGFKKNTPKAAPAMNQPTM